MSAGLRVSGSSSCGEALCVRRAALTPSKKKFKKKGGKDSSTIDFALKDLNNMSRNDCIAVVVKSLHWNLELKPGFVRLHTR
jgi:hypothetical protein